MGRQLSTNSEKQVVRAMARQIKSPGELAFPLKGHNIGGLTIPMQRKEKESCCVEV